MSNFLLSQICGLIALILCIWSYFVDNKIKFLIISIFINIFYAFSFLFVDEIAGGILTLAAILRCVYLIFDFKYNIKHSSLYLSLFIVLYIIITIIFWKSWLDLIPLTTCTIYTIAYAIKDMQKMRYVLLIPSVMLIIYCIVVGAYTSSLLDVFGIITLVIAIIHFKKENRDIDANKQEINN